MIERTLRQKLLKGFQSTNKKLSHIVQHILTNSSDLPRIAARYNAEAGQNYSIGDFVAEQQVNWGEYQVAEFITSDAKTIVFDYQQALALLSEVTRYSDSLDFLLPFPKVFLQFAQPIPVFTSGFNEYSIGLLIAQDTVTSDRVKRMAIPNKAGISLLNELDLPEGSAVRLNNLVVVYEDLNIRRFTWTNEGNAEHFDQQAKSEYDRVKQVVKNLAIACIGYINCENIYLHKTEGAPERVNQKRERQGKALLEPYYTCRIRGVQYGSDGKPVNKGTHHGHIYDVRGHFRRLATGKATWVQPHQRGLQSGGPYIPKTYVVDKGR